MEFIICVWGIGIWNSKVIGTWIEIGI